MKTFSLDPYYGKPNPEVDWIAEKAREQLKSILNEFIMNCIENDIETCSATGAFINMVFTEFVSTQCSQVYKFQKQQEEQKDESSQ